jgi:hypothetical protein
MTLGSNTDEARTTRQPDIFKCAAVLAAIKTKPGGGRRKAASLDSVCARRPVRSRSGRKKACGAVEQKK